MEYSKSRFEKFLFFDIETCGQHPTLQKHAEANGPVVEKIFAEKSARLQNGKGWTGEPHADYTRNVSLFPEFGRIACVSYGLWKNGEMQINSVADADEKTLLKKVANLFHRAGASGLIPTGWNIKNFDIAWIVKRLLINGIQVPLLLSSYEKKPWEMTAFDLKDYWKSGSSLDTTFEEACFAMGIPSPKDDINGSQVHEEFWSGGIDRIVTYCEKDVRGMILLAEKIYNIYNPETIKENTYYA